MNILKLIKNPLIVYHRLKKVISSQEFTASPEYRSHTEETGHYLKSVINAVNSYKHFKRFKRDKFYKEILEHVSMKDGKIYLNIAKSQTPELFNRALKEVLFSDETGCPEKFYYSDFGNLSPTSLRYVKVASDLKILFDNNIGESICEIGCGYGGQAIVLDKLFNLKKITLFDLPDVNRLIEKYMESFLINSSYTTSTLNKAKVNEFDLIISNYAFSELPKVVQLKYIEKVINKSQKGYLTMNTGIKPNDDEGSLTIDELRNELPAFEIFEDKPNTGPFNYIIVWGHNKEAAKKIFSIKNEKLT